MSEIKLGLPPANSAPYGSSLEQTSHGVTASGHMQTAHGEMAVVQVEATQLASKPPVENLFGANVQQRIVAVAETSSPEQTAKDQKTIYQAANDFKELRENPRKALAAIVARLAGE